jgi:hypothetical protein
VLTEDEIASRFARIRPFLDERQRRLWLGSEAAELGVSGVAIVARAVGADPKTVRRGRDELAAGIVPDGRVRGPGGGRQSVTDLDAGLAPALRELVDPETRGDPMSPLCWTTKSTALSEWSSPSTRTMWVRGRSYREPARRRAVRVLSRLIDAPRLTPCTVLFSFTVAT